jgi:hypothetical protein
MERSCHRENGNDIHVPKLFTNHSKYTANVKVSKSSPRSKQKVVFQEILIFLKYEKV